MISGTFTINSTLDNASGLLSKYVYDETKTNLPIAVLIHGFNLTIDAISDSILERVANEGFFAVAIGMRGRKGATGRRDASARELHDIYDGINHIKNNFPVSDKVIVSGYSGGGGNALGFAVKFPFVANTIVNHFGMVDYGYDDVESWYSRNSQYRDGIESFVGHSRVAQNLEYYRTRNSYEALSNLQARVFNYHDSEDTGVSVQLTTYLRDELNRLSKDHQTKISTTSSSVRYLHNMSASAKTENEWLPYGNTANKPIMPPTGKLRVLGYVVTDNFELFLGGLDDHVADFSYNLLENEFTITPLTGTMEVRMVRGNEQQLLTIKQPTTFIFEGEYIPVEPVEDPKNIKSYYVKIDGEFVQVNKRFVKINDNWELVK